MLCHKTQETEDRLIHLSNDSFVNHITTGKIHVKSETQRAGFLCYKYWYLWFLKDLENHKEITKAKECVEPRLCIATHILSKANSCGPLPMHKCYTHWCDWPCWLQADLAEQDRIKRLRMRMWVDWLEVWGMRIVINVLVFVLLCGSLALIGFTTSKMIDVSID